MATATKFMKFSRSIVFFRYNFSLTKCTQFGNDSNCSKFNGENIATNCSMVKVPALAGLTKKRFGHYAILKFPPSDHQVYFFQMNSASWRFWKLTLAAWPLASQ